jgi:hypothetical protein
MQKISNDQFSQTLEEVRNDGSTLLGAFRTNSTNLDEGIDGLYRDFENLQKNALVVREAGFYKKLYGLFWSLFGYKDEFYDDITKVELSVEGSKKTVDGLSRIALKVQNNLRSYEKFTEDVILLSNNCAEVLNQNKELIRRIDILSDEVKDLRKDNADLKKDNADLKKDNADLKAKVDAQTAKIDLILKTMLKQKQQKQTTIWSRII